MPSIDFFSVKENMDFVDWLIQKGLGTGEAAHVLCDMQMGDSFGCALLKVFKRREDFNRTLAKPSIMQIESEMNNWKIIRSKSGKTSDGFPDSQILCRSPEEIPQTILDHKIADPVITDYLEEMKCKLDKKGNDGFNSVP